MSTLCDALVALHMTFGVFCQTPADVKHAPMPADDKKAWTINIPKPKPAPPPPPFPPVIIRQEAPPTPLPVRSAPPPPPPASKPQKPPKNPYRAALEQALRGRGAARASFNPIEGAAPASVPGGPGTMLPPALGPLDLPANPKQRKYDAKGQTSGLPVDNSRILTADRYIPGVMETGFNSQLDSTSGGTVIIQTSRDVFGYHGRNILIPKGSRMICSYGAPAKQGESRVPLSCKRILIAGHRAEILHLAAPIGDAQGRAGVAGRVDNRFWERYGTAFILAGLSAAVRAATSAGGSGGGGSTTSTIASKGSEELSQKLGEITASVLEQTVNLAPVVSIAQGKRVQIRPAQDWYIKEVGEGK